ncbi:flagellar basal body-associated FliL family protein [Pseudemcibacter aquimaris]|uniref:flagellar basal body-associated FliL family protein n=1 Tax=Pseudemcibacter aquimaris TaxID=2857064 RepID=UPI0020120096|nr:flagellar basal body-associated FliL family protein [Pseudemcibacter aquimaris]MCC3860814.1 flagellar basal body-associated FliL family protein [Pseudemcibacter aquimaris]WDU59634.1 flagellar basal body-associated FliL family protein [Pseudemcibacter aquimaris]
MSDEENADLEGGLEDGLEQKKFSGKKMIMIIVPVLLLLIGGGAAYMFMGGDEPEQLLDENGNPIVAEAEAEEEEALELLFYDIEPMLVNLTSAGGKSAYLKLSVTLEVDKQSSVEELELNLPRIVDNFQVYLRELRLEDINGSAGMFRLKEELLIRVNETIYPTRVNDVLFKEMLING